MFKTVLTIMSLAVILVILARVRLITKKQSPSPPNKSGQKQFPSNLPNSDDEDLELTPRTPAQVAQRVVALLAIIDKVHKIDEIDSWVSTHHIDTYFSDIEKEFFYDPSPDQKIMIAFSWKAECLVPLLWALGIIDKTPDLNKTVDLNLYKQQLLSIYQSPESFIENATLRPPQEIQKLEEHLYHQHWRTRDAYLFNKPMPDELNPGIVYERRYAASWMVGWGEDWDDVPTDT